MATSSSGTVCYALSDGQWDGTGTPTEDQLEYGCGGQLWMGPNRPPEHLTRPDQFGGFFAAEVGLVVYGVSPYPRATEVIVEGDGVDRTLPVRADSLGYGDAFPEASQATSLTLTFLDAGGQVLGSKRVVAQVG